MYQPSESRTLVGGPSPPPPTPPPLAYSKSSTGIAQDNDKGTQPVPPCPAFTCLFDILLLYDPTKSLGLQWGVPCRHPPPHPLLPTPGSSSLHSTECMSLERINNNIRMRCCDTLCQPSESRTLVLFFFFS